MEPMVYVNYCEESDLMNPRCQLALTRITHQVSRAFDLNLEKQGKDKPERGADLGVRTV